jgi:hypothetical protein
MTEGWAQLVAWGPGIPDGIYCPEHARAIEAIEADIGEDQAKASRPRKRRPSR